ncbi:MAG: GNAT family N-acetyltransferase [Candidatus Aenigmarchaeota archaeon]|nr:GNAT family N-acetyltransferase [Candidatus Aenigmarchaeota archaeon]
MEIREAELSDVLGITELINSVSKEEIHQTINWIKTADERRELFKVYLKKAEKGRKIMFVCIEDDKLIGSASASRKSGKRNHVWEIGYQIKKEWRGKGVGSGLLSKLLKSLKNMKAEQAIAWVVETNKNSIKLLRKFGFKETGKIKNGVKTGSNYCDYLIFQLELNALKK